MRKFIGTIILLGIIGFVVFLVREVRGLASGTATYGVTFSRPYAQALGLDWRATYLAILDDLGARRLRLPIYWSDVESEQGAFDFTDYDWMITEAARRNAALIIALGKRTPRNLDCRLPEWGSALDKNAQAEALRNYIITAVNRYKSYQPIIAWQIEEYPFAVARPCALPDAQLTSQEVSLVRGLDTRPIVMTDVGVFSLWIPAARRGDWFGTAITRHIWTKWTGYFTSPVPSDVYKIKRVLTQLFARPQRMLVIDLQAEPVVPDELVTRYDVTSQYRSMNPEKFQKTLDYAKSTSFETFYLTGAEWWYWLKIKEGKPEMWDAARKLF